MWDPSSQDLRDVYCMGFMFAEMLALEPKTQIAGVTLVADMEGFGFTHFRSLTLDDVKNVVAFFQVSLNPRLHTLKGYSRKGLNARIFLSLRRVFLAPTRAPSVFLINFPGDRATSRSKKEGKFFRVLFKKI